MNKHKHIEDEFLIIRYMWYCGLVLWRVIIESDNSNECYYCGKNHNA